MKVGIKRHDESIFASEVYRELERQAVRKGHFKPTEEDQVKLAAQEIKTPKMTGDLVGDIGVLALELRTKGYVKQAEDLEQKLVLYKQAEVHMYNVHDEKGEDVLNFAHKDGDIEIVPAQEERGKVETVQSAAKKILEVVQKQPTGKVGSKTGGMRKTAQEALTPAEGQLPPGMTPGMVGYGKGAEDKINKVLTALGGSLKFDTDRIPAPKFAGLDFRAAENPAAAQKQYEKWAKIPAGSVAAYYRILDSPLFARQIKYGSQLTETWFHGQITQKMGARHSDTTSAVQWIKGVAQLLGISIHEGFLVAPADAKSGWNNWLQLEQFKSNVARALADGFRAQYNKVWGGPNNEKITQADAQIAGIYKAVIAEIAKASDWRTLGTIRTTEADDVDLASAMAVMQGSLNHIKTASGSKQYQTDLLPLYRALNLTQAHAFQQFFKKAVEAISKATKELTRNIPGAMGDVKGQTSTAYEVQRMWYDAMQGEQDPKERAWLAEQHNKAKEMVAFIAQYEGGPFALMKPQIRAQSAAIGPEFAAISTLQELVGYLQEAKADTMSALGVKAKPRRAAKPAAAKPAGRAAKPARRAAKPAAKPAAPAAAAPAAAAKPAGKGGMTPEQIRGAITGKV
jgi:hypothetical protein